MRILFIDHSDGHDPVNLLDKPSGGTLTSLTYIPKYLASKGHEVYVRSTYGPKGVIDGVTYIGAEEALAKWDVTVFNRNVLPKDYLEYHKQQGIKTVWWLHDMVDTRYLRDDAFKFVDHIVALSDYCRRTYSEFYLIPAEKFSVIPNGVDKSIFYPGDYAKRNPHLFLMASALIKGYVPIEITYNSLGRADWELDFRIYSNQSLHGKDNTENDTKFLAAMHKLGAHVYSPVSQRSMASLMRQAWAFLMPNSYPEICSNLLLQAQASGLPVLSSAIGASPEFITNGETGLMTAYHPHDWFMWMVEYARLAVELSKNAELHKHISEQAPRSVMDWNEIGEKWDVVLHQIVAGEAAAIPAA